MPGFAEKGARVESTWDAGAIGTVINKRGDGVSAEFVVAWDGSVTTVCTIHEIDEMPAFDNALHAAGVLA